MATNTTGALKAFIEAVPGVGVAAGGPVTCHADIADENAAEPYIVITGPNPIVMDPLEDGGSPLAAGAQGVRIGSTQTGTDLMYVDLWQKWRNADFTLAESPTLANELIKALNGARLPSHPQVVYACKVTGAPRLFDRDANLIHHALTVEVHRQF